MEINTFNLIKQWFKQYSESFLADKRIAIPVQIKIDHTERVAVEMADLADSLHLSAQDRRMALTIAWLHDTGRFPQVDKYNTMNDSTSENHALLGLKVINEHNVLSDLEQQEQILIIKAIENHNRLAIEAGLDERTQMFCKLIRDADKLDIWKVIIKIDGSESGNEMGALLGNLSDTDDCAEDIIEDIHREKVGKFSSIKTYNDFRLIVMSWVFDLYFDQTRCKVMERKYIESFAQRLPDRPEIQRAKDKILSFLWKSNDRKIPSEEI